MTKKEKELIKELLAKCVYDDRAGLEGHSRMECKMCYDTAYHHKNKECIVAKVTQLVEKA